MTIQKICEACRGRNPNGDFEIRKWVVSDPGTKRRLPSSPSIHSLFIMYLYLEAINVLLKASHNSKIIYWCVAYSPCPEYVYKCNIMNDKYIPKGWIIPGMNPSVNMIRREF